MLLSDQVGLVLLLGEVLHCCRDDVVLVDLNGRAHLLGDLDYINFCATRSI